VNAALARLVYVPRPGFCGFDTLRVSAQLARDDAWWLGLGDEADAEAGGGDGGAAAHVQLIPVAVAPIASAPSVVAPAAPLVVYSAEPGEAGGDASGDAGGLEFDLDLDADAGAGSVGLVGLAVLDDDFPRAEAVAAAEACAVAPGATRFEVPQPQPPLRASVSARAGRVVAGAWPARHGAAGDAAAGAGAAGARAPVAVSGSAQRISQQLRWLTYIAPPAPWAGEDEITVAVADGEGAGAAAAVGVVRVTVRAAPARAPGAPAPPARIALSLAGADASLHADEGAPLALGGARGRLRLQCFFRGGAAARRAAAAEGHDCAGEAALAAGAGDVRARVRVRAGRGAACLAWPCGPGAGARELAFEATLLQAGCLLGGQGARCGAELAALARARGLRGAAAAELFYFGGNHSSGLDSLDVEVRAVDAAAPFAIATGAGAGAGAGDDAGAAAGAGEGESAGADAGLGVGDEISVPVWVHAVASAIALEAVPASAAVAGARLRPGALAALPRFALWDPDGNASFVLGAVPMASAGPYYSVGGGGGDGDGGDDDADDADADAEARAAEAGAGAGAAIFRYDADARLLSVELECRPRGACAVVAPFITVVGGRAAPLHSLGASRAAPRGLEAGPADVVGGAVSFRASSRAVAALLAGRAAPPLRCAAAAGARARADRDGNCVGARVGRGPRLGRERERDDRRRAARAMAGAGGALGGRRGRRGRRGRERACLRRF